MKTYIQIRETSRRGIGPDSVYKKIKNFNINALKGYAKKVTSIDPLDIKSWKDTETAIDEIMGELFDDDWERDLLKKGVLDESVLKPIKQSDFAPIKNMISAFKPGGEYFTLLVVKKHMEHVKKFIQKNDNLADRLKEQPVVSKGSNTVEFDFYGD